MSDVTQDRADGLTDLEALQQAETIVADLQARQHAEFDAIRARLNTAISLLEGEQS